MLDQGEGTTGYTHYWEGKITPDLMVGLAEDMTKIHAWCTENGIPLAGGMGTGEPVITTEEICFNGAEPDDYETVRFRVTPASTSARPVGCVPTTLPFAPSSCECTLAAVGRSKSVRTEVGTSGTRDGASAKRSSTTCR